MGDRFAVHPLYVLPDGSLIFLILDINQSLAVLKLEIVVDT